MSDVLHNSLLEENVLLEKQNGRTTKLQEYIKTVWNSAVVIADVSQVLQWFTVWTPHYAAKEDPIKD